MLTTARLVEFVLIREGFRSLVYDDARPWVVLKPGDDIEGTLTYGHGLTRRADGSPLQIGDTIEEQESRDRVARYIRENVEPALENLIHISLAGFQYDALGSLIYQYGEPEVAGWRLIRRINAGENWEAIALEWINGTVFWRGKPAFWTRRVSELLMFFDLDWRAGENVTPENDVLDVIEEMGFDGVMPKAGPVHTPTEMEALQYEGAQAVGYEGTIEEFVGHRSKSIARQKNVVNVPALETTESKLIEDSTTGRGYAKETAGRENMVVGGTLAVIGSAIPTIEKTTGYFEDFSTGAIIRTILVVGFIIVSIGLWRWHRGRVIKHEGRLTATQPKV